MRIVSLLPSATEIVCALGLAEQLVGVTHECDFPRTVIAKPKVTRTHIPTDAASAEIDRLVTGQLGAERALYSLNFDAVEELQPDLIITQTLCDVCAVADVEVRAAAKRLRQAPRVIYLEPTRFRDLFEDILEVGAAAGVVGNAKSLVEQLARRVEAVRARVAERGESPRRVGLIEWLDPLFSCGHWTPELVALAGGNEPFAKAGERSRRMSFEELRAEDPDILVIACCGFTIERTHAELDRFFARPEVSGLRAVREQRVWVVDGSAYFSRPGPRLVDSLELLAHAIEPTRFDVPEPLRRGADIIRIDSTGNEL